MGAMPKKRILLVVKRELRPRGTCCIEFRFNYKFPKSISVPLNDYFWNPRQKILTSKSVFSVEGMEIPVLKNH